VKNDAPHFTYLGVAESALSSLGLRRDSNRGRTIWVPNIEAHAREASAGNKKTGPTKKEPKLNAADKKSKKTEGEDDSDASEPFVEPASSIRTKVTGTVGSNVALTKEMEPLLRKLTQLYFEISGGFLYITSGYRSPERQASAMCHNLIAYGIPYVIGTYGGRQAVVEIVEAFRRNPGDREKATRAMTKVIQAQMIRGVYISDHLLGKAFDIRLSSAKLSALREVVRGMGGRLGVERDHYHVAF
jgi:uncharacterized protein YcbK (DUF882 family)